MAHSIPISRTSASPCWVPPLLAPPALRCPGSHRHLSIALLAFSLVRKLNLACHLSYKKHAQRKQNHKYKITKYKNPLKAGHKDSYFSKISSSWCHFYEKSWETCNSDSDHTLGICIFHVKHM